MATAHTSRVRRCFDALALPLIAIVVVAVMVAGSYRLGHLNEAICDGPCGAEYVEPPEELASIVAGEPAATRSLPIAGPAKGELVERAVSPTLQLDGLGSQIGFTAVDARTGERLWSTNEKPLIPASTNKLFTTFAALKTIDPQHRFTTTVRRPDRDHVVLVGGGDPYLSGKKSKPGDYPKLASIEVLAKRTARELRTSGQRSVSLSYDATLFSGPTASPAWESFYVSESIVTSVSALWVDEGGKGGVRDAEPALSAAQAFAAALKAENIEVGKRIEPTAAPIDAPTIAKVSGPTVAQITESINQRSDNEAAEVLFRQVALAIGEPGSFAGGVRAVMKVLTEAGIDVSATRIHDGSGLSRQNRTTTATLADVLYTASQHQRTKSLLATLPIAGFNGSLRDRFAGRSQALGLVHAKTGTLSGVQGLAGLAIDIDGRPIIVAVLSNRGPSLYAGRTAIDRVVAAVSACDCG